MSKSVTAHGVFGGRCAAQTAQEQHQAAHALVQAAQSALATLSSPDDDGPFEMCQGAELAQRVLVAWGRSAAEGLAATEAVTHEEVRREMESMGIDHVLILVREECLGEVASFPSRPQVAPAV